MPFLLALKTFLVAVIRQKQAGTLALPADRGIMGKHIENNHVPGVLGKSFQVHIPMTMVILRSGFEPHFLHQLAYGLMLRHGVHLLFHVPDPSQ